MNNQVIISSNSVEAAVEEALSKLETSRNKVDIKIMEEGKKGFFGIGSKKAIVKVTKKVTRVLDLIDNEEKVEFKAKKDNNYSFNKDSEVDNTKKIELNIQKDVKLYLEENIHNMGIEVEVDVKVKDLKIVANMKSNKVALIIGKRGCIINSLQLLTQIHINNKYGKPFKVILDAEGYREKRVRTLQNLAIKNYERALILKKEIALEPMSSYERKIIHDTLNVHKNSVRTFSVGKGKERHVIIAPRKKDNT